MLVIIVLNNVYFFDMINSLKVVKIPNIT